MLKVEKFETFNWEGAIIIVDKNYNYLYVSSELVSEAYQNLAEFYKSYY